MSVTTENQPSTSTAAGPISTVGQHLFRTLIEAGVRSVFGAPGGQNTELREEAAATRQLTWIEAGSQHGAAYAASMYARMSGLGVAVIPAQTEGQAVPASDWSLGTPAPVVHVYATPPRPVRSDLGAPTTSTPPGCQDRSGFAFAACTDLRPATAAAEIERVLHVALQTGRPVSIAIPADVAKLPLMGGADRARFVRLRDDRMPASGCREGDYVAANHTSALRNHPRADRPAAPRSADRHAPLSMASLRVVLEEAVLPRDLVLTDQETTVNGAASVSLPDGAHLICQPLWATSRWALAAALGASLAASDRRVIVVGGNASVHEQPAELGALLSHGLAPVVVSWTFGCASSETSSAWPEVPTTAASPAFVRAACPSALARAFRQANGAAGPTLIDAVLGGGNLSPATTESIR